VGVVTCERQARPFAEADVRLIRAACDLCVRRLADLRKLDRWFGARLAEAVRAQLAKLVGFEHTWAKTVGALVSILLAVIVLGWAPYRVEAPFILQAEDAAYIPAPFGGYIGEVLVRPGEAVARGAPLLKLDTRDLLLEEAAASADVQRYQREADKARADDRLAEMRIATALADQARARLDLVRYRMEKSALVSPIDGVVAEGDLKDKIGSPVQQGDVLFRVVNTGRLYAELRVSETDIHEVRGGAGGFIAFASRPRLKFPVRVERVEPVAQPDRADNVFVVRCALEGAAEEWWRPGMSGVAKVRVGWRNIFWIYTHKTMDFLRLKLWW
jgi:multidrug resistance efflux pump